MLSTRLHTGEDLVVKLDFRWPSVDVGVFSRCVFEGRGGGAALPYVFVAFTCPNLKTLHTSKLVCRST